MSRKEISLVLYVRIKQISQGFVRCAQKTAPINSSMLRYGNSEDIGGLYKAAELMKPTFVRTYIL